MAGTDIERTSDQAPSHSELEVHTSHPHPVYNPDAPSEAWGWHGTWGEFAPRGRNLLLGMASAIMFVMLIGNHVSRVEDWWLVIIGIILAVFAIRSQLAVNRARRRR